MPGIPSRGHARHDASSLRADERHLPCHALLERLREQPALAVGEGPDRLRLHDAVTREELPAPRAAPAPLAHQQIADGPALRGVRTVKYDFSGGDLTQGDAALQ